MEPWSTLIDEAVLLSATGATPGPAGTLTASVRPLGTADPDLSNNHTRSTIDLQNSAGADLIITSPTISAHLGDTVTIPVRITNKGPNTEPWLSFGFSRTPDGVDIPDGLAMLSGIGCTGSAATLVCRIDTLIPGASRTINLRAKIKYCPRPWYGNGFGLVTMLSDPTIRDRDHAIKVQPHECQPATGSPPGSGRSGDHAASPRPLAVITPAVTASSPSNPNISSEGPAQVLAQDPNELTATATPLRRGPQSWLWPTLLGILLAGTAGLLTARHRTRRTNTHDHTDSV